MMRFANLRGWPAPRFTGFRSPLSRIHFAPSPGEIERTFSRLWSELVKGETEAASLGRTLAKGSAEHETALARLLKLTSAREAINRSGATLAEKVGMAQKVLHWPINQTREQARAAMELENLAWTENATARWNTMQRIEADLKKAGFRVERPRRPGEESLYIRVYHDPTDPNTLGEIRISSHKSPAGGAYGESGERIGEATISIDPESPWTTADVVPYFQREAEHLRTQYVPGERWTNLTTMERREQRLREHGYIGEVAAAPSAKQPWEMTRREYQATGGSWLPADHPLRTQGTEAIDRLRIAEKMLTEAGSIWIHKTGMSLAERQSTLGAALEYRSGQNVPDALRSTKVPRALKDEYRQAKSASEEASNALDDALDHRQAVSEALREGKPVPAEVLADYPGLVRVVAPPVSAQATGLAAPAPARYVVILGRQVPVKNMEDASRAVLGAGEATGYGGSKLGVEFPVMEGGKEIAWVSYNGKVWVGQRGKLTGNRLVYDPYNLPPAR